MLDKPRHDMIEPSSSAMQLLAGEKFTGNEQCELVFGPGSKVCSYMVSWIVYIPDLDTHCLERELSMFCFSRKSKHK